ncbi:glycoside hydrolase family 20 zincin-like fold domain-containing protein [Cohnella sp.]|uniref:glycoside hydrolase family 20 zincin-like fold domain-containing protein n=1 Tax=Cohnella sp. TaxID=1883426 RepID=UPI0037043E54
MCAMLLPEPKKAVFGEGTTGRFVGLNLITAKIASPSFDAKEIAEMKLWNYQDLAVRVDEADSLLIDIELSDALPAADGQIDRPELYEKQGFSLRVGSSGVEIAFAHRDGYVNALSTLKQLLVKHDEGGYTLQDADILDWPSIERRSVSNTFAWYAGYGRIGFDMQLWGYDEWIEYLNICSDLKINQFNMCMYGYWPFQFDEYPETMLQGYKMKVWNEESRNWIEIAYTHPNISDEFLSRLFAYGHKLGIDFFAYIGLNSYNGGYPSIYKDKRMVLPKDGKFVNDFDTLCLSRPENIAYLKAAVRRVVQLGFDGIDFEESEESYWFCNCAACAETFMKNRTPAEAKHKANFWLLNTLYTEIKDENPDCVVGVRAWREPPLEKDLAYLEDCKRSIPEDIVLFWAPGLYVSDDEFPKWVDVFGKERIWARDTEANAVASTMGRLMRIFKTNVIRADEETNHQYIEKDIDMHIDSVKHGVKGINGYMFEWYGYFLNLYSHAYYGWGSTKDHETFYRYSVEAVFGAELANDILYVLRRMLTIHESQFNIFPTEFPFLRNKVKAEDIPVIQEAIKEWPELGARIRRIKEAIRGDERLKVYVKHFDKIENSHERNRVIYDLALASISYDLAVTPEDKRTFLREMDRLNELDFDLVKRMYFDVNPVDETGMPSCMYPYHELKRVIHNELDPDNRNDRQVFLGVEAFGWLWL